MNTPFLFPFPPIPMIQTPFGILNKPSMASPLYIGDLDENIHEETLHDFFSKFGPLHFVRIMRDPITGKSRGFAYVNYLHPRDAESAIQYAQYEKIGRKHIRILFKRNVRDLPPEANLFVKNLDPSVTVKDLHKFFSEAGANILCAKVATDTEGQSLGYGYVQFEKKEDAERALDQFQGQRLKENEIQLLAFVPKNKRAGAVTKKNIYVKHLPEDCSEEELSTLVRDLFSVYGEIETHVIKKHPKENKYSAFVCFKEENAAQIAVEDLNKNPKDLGSSEGPLYVAWHQNKFERVSELKRRYQQIQNETNLYVKNLKPEVTEQDLKDAFQQFGTITSIACKDWVSIDKQKKARCGFIAFDDAGDAQKAYYQAVNEPEIKNLYLSDAKPYVSLHQSREKRKEYIYSQRKWKQMNLRGMSSGVLARGGGPNGTNPNFLGGPGAMRNRNLPPFPVIGGISMVGCSGLKRVDPRVHTTGWKKGPRLPKWRPQQRPVWRPVQPNKPAEEEAVENKQQRDVSSRVTVSILRARLAEFLELDALRQRQILGELLFPLVREISGDTLAPKITGMLVDLSVLDVPDVLELLENTELLEERVHEATGLIESEGL